MGRIWILSRTLSTLLSDRRTGVLLFLVLEGSRTKFLKVSELRDIADGQPQGLTHGTLGLPESAFPELCEDETAGFLNSFMDTQSCLVCQHPQRLTFP